MKSVIGNSIKKLSTGICFISMTGVVITLLAIDKLINGKHLDR